MLRYIADAIAFGVWRLMRAGEPEPGSDENRAHAHWDFGRRQWVVRGGKADRAA